ncbi:PaaI family thioesterase [Daejeonia sp. YH14]|uniref:PaaI family thioesterase n=1 Tax=Daejeonia sp. YH14 TaxID=3439042 RepID=UPI003F4906D6
MDDLQKNETLEKLNQWAQNTLNETLDILFTDITEDSLSATMPVTPRIHQPYGIMHGGASCVLAETLGSTLSYLHIDRENFIPVGTSINSHHLRAIKSGTVTGKATFIRKGNTMHVSQIEIRDERGHLINHTTMTNNIIPHKKIQD